MMTITPRRNQACSLSGGGVSPLPIRAHVRYAHSDFVEFYFCFRGLKILINDKKTIPLRISQACSLSGGGVSPLPIRACVRYAHSDFVEFYFCFRGLKILINDKKTIPLRISQACSLSGVSGGLSRESPPDP